MVAPREVACRRRVGSAASAAPRYHARPRLRRALAGPAVSRELAREPRRWASSSSSSKASSPPSPSPPLPPPSSSSIREDVDAYTAELLDWENVCSHVSIFTSTKLGRLRCYEMRLGANLEESLCLQAETRAVHCLEAELGKRIEFNGVDSSSVRSALKRTGNGGRLSPELLNSLLRLMRCMQQAQSLVRSTVQSQKGAARERLVPLADMVDDLSTCRDLQKEISRRVDEDGNVRDSASKTLSKLRAQIGVLERKVLSQVRGKGENPTTHRGRVCLEIYPSELPKYEKSFLLIGSAEQGGTLFVEPASAIGLNNKLMELRGQEAAEVETICWRLTEECSGSLTELEELFDVLIELDVVVARSRYTLSVDGNWPQLVDPGSGAAANERFSVRLKQLRNPLLLWEQRKAQMSSQAHLVGEGNAPVPVDIFVERGVSAIVITGPNTGGKTACMKALGVVSLMSRAGLGIPASGSVILPSFDNVYADIGDEQSLSNNLSTFSSHVSNIQRISEHCTSRSLVLLDELGTGTDPMEGSALGTAIVRSFLDRALLTIATTHFAHVGSLKYLDRRVENAAVDFDRETLRPTYQVVWGASGRSNALHIARALGLQDAILEQAEEISGRAEEEAGGGGGGGLGSALEEMKEGIAESSRGARVAMSRSRDLYECARDALGSLRETQLELSRRSGPEVQKLVDGSRVRVKEAMKERVRAEAEDRRRATSEARGVGRVGDLVTKAQRKKQKKLQRARQKQRERREVTQPGAQAAAGAIATGSTVFVPQFRAKARVLSVTGADLLVQVGSVKMKVKRSNVQYPCP
ncbi:endonuclease MutS2 [Chloropicon roscoffensis]|uniref:Endonuclease MutS2 n=3 Tax=Chloropicon roscoffensis TaxID=1461544 RepID=A0AAX4P9Z0_9CHLO